MAHRQQPHTSFEVLDWLPNDAAAGGWIDRFGDGTVWTRPNGCAGAPTASVLSSPTGWICQTWLLQPARTMIYKASAPWWKASFELFAAEQCGQSDGRWLPIRSKPGDKFEGWYDLATCEGSRYLGRVHERPLPCHTRGQGVLGRQLLYRNREQRTDNFSGRGGPFLDHR